MIALTATGSLFVFDDLTTEDNVHDSLMRQCRNLAREKRARRKLQPDKYALYCERERARKARARKEGGEVDEADEDEDRELV